MGGASLPGWMAPNVADALWCRQRRLRGQPPFQSDLVGRRISGWELQASTEIVGS
jgi:hypothetical protein